LPLKNRKQNNQKWFKQLFYIYIYLFVTFAPTSN